VSTDFDPYGVPVHDAATVMLLREGEGGLEVFMRRRTLAAVFAGGLFVFPGGRVDPADAMPAVAAVCRGLDDETASARLGIASGGLAFWIGAIRECFEEAGVLLAAGPDGGTVRFDTSETAQRFTWYRHRIHDGELGLVELCAAEGLHLTVGELGYVAHWITPVGERRRFDTRFFVARAPGAQEPLHDDTETIDSRWVRPRDALERNRAGELALLPPTEASLEFLAPFESAGAVLAHAVDMAPPPPILPKARLDRAGRVLGVVLPADPRYPTLPDLVIED
jgi:8-oxo-dGTP pyrophosphatase MutT (NUDIX family)